MGAVNNVNSALDSYYKKNGYRRQDAAKGKNKEQVAPQEEPGIVLSISSSEQNMFGTTQSEAENTISQMLNNLKGASDLDAEAALLAAKRQILDMLIKSARTLLSVRYTSRSWKRVVEALKQALPLAGSEKAVMLDRAISIMRGGLAGLELADPNQDDGGIREQLPIDQSGAGADTAAAPTVATGGAVSVAANAVNISA